MTTEVKKFDEMAHDDWWSPKGRLFSLHRINPLRFEYFSSKAGKLEGKRVLDVGCGGGILAEKFAEAGALVTGIDLSPVAIETAKRHAEAGGLKIDYRVSSTSKLLAENPEPFDFIVCAEVLEHVDDLQGFIGHSIEMLRPGGLYFFGTINKTLKARFFAIFVAEDILRMVPPGTHDYKRFVKPSVLAESLREKNVEIKEIKGMSYDPFKLEFKISNDPSVNYLGYAQKVLPHG
jgi:2-polyprenyl-6-hydroxyphenyl methylase/3-demethylubiquinone-9 3-methyltransferase